MSNAKRVYPMAIGYRRNYPNWAGSGSKEDDSPKSIGENDELSKMQNFQPLAAKKDHRRIMGHLLRQSFPENMDKLPSAAKKDHRRIMSNLLGQSFPENMDKLPSANINEITKRLGKGGLLNLVFDKRLGKGSWLDTYLLYSIRLPRLK
jgi:hypothetical protein